MVNTIFEKNFKKFQIYGTIFRKNILAKNEFNLYNRAVGGEIESHEIDR